MNRYEKEQAAMNHIKTTRPMKSEGWVLGIVVLIFAAILLGFNLYATPEAHGAKRAVYKGAVTIVVSPTTKSDPYGQYVNTKLWNLPAAAKAAGIGRYRIVSTKYANTAYGDVYVRSIGGSAPLTHVYKLVDSGEIWESQVTMGDRAGAKLTATQRHAALVKALKTAVPR